MIDGDVRNNILLDIPVFGSADDYSSNGVVLTNTNAVLTTDAYGRANRAYEFSSALTSQLFVAGCTALENAIGISVAFDFNNYTLPATGVNEYFFTFMFSNLALGIRISGTNLVIGGRSHSADSYLAPAVATSGLFAQNANHKMVAVWDYINKKILGYIDGVKILESAVDWTYNYLNFTGGGTLSIGTTSFNGKMSNFRIYNRVLGLGEVKILAKT